MDSTNADANIEAVANINPTPETQGTGLLSGQRSRSNPHPTHLFCAAAKRGIPIA